jgi:class 3 adenylate cyclase
MLPERGAEVRVSDAERDRVIAFLRKSCGEGLLTLDEFSDRVGDVYSSRTSAELERVTADLPVPVVQDTPGRTPSRSRRAVRWTISFLSGNSQKGRWRIEGETTAISFMGGCELDLRQAEVVGDHAVINAVAFMGGVDIVVPEGIEVVMNVIPFMGGRSCRVKRVPVIPGSPVIEVRGLAFMGGVSVRSKGHPDEQPRRGRHDHLPPPPAPPRPPLPQQEGIERVTGTVQSEWRSLHSHVAPDGTVTIMFSDIEGYTSMVERLGDNKAQQVLRAHNEIIRRQVEAHGGFEVKVQGDGFMLAFSSAARALRCAVAIQRDFEAYNAEHPDEPLKVRMGLHTGEAIRDADDFLGTTVILASRIASSATGGQIFVSSLLRELCSSSGEFSFDGGIEVELKGLSRPHRVFAVDWQSTESP